MYILFRASLIFLGTKFLPLLYPKSAFLLKKVEEICTLKPHYANEMGVSTSSSLLDSITFMLFLTDIRESKYCRKHIEEHLVQWADELVLTAVLLFGHFQWLFCKLQVTTIFPGYTHFFTTTWMRSDNYANIHACMARSWGKGHAFQCKSGLENTYVIFLRALTSPYSCL